MSITEFSKRVGVSVPTLRRWEKQKKFKCIKLPSGQRRYTQEMVDEILKLDKDEEEMLSKFFEDTVDLVENKDDDSNL